MRRLANQSRDDTYASRRDYQQLEPRVSVGLYPAGDGPYRVAFEPVALPPGTDLAAAGGFIRGSAATTIELTVATADASTRREFSLGERWRRVGLAFQAASPALSVSLAWGSGYLSLWGVAAGPVELTEDIRDGGAALAELNQDHLVPETYYLPHDAALGLNIDAEESTPLDIEDGEEIMTKKCSYCGRWLAVDLFQPGKLSFHKHSAKVTGHQNECRACKKWRINDTFNPIRTVDQLHESSVITRERKLLLREPELVRKIKDRTGAGLKTQVWERFGKRCFKCKRPLSPSEVRLDHTRPLAYLWPLDEHATCLCETHNGEKGDKFPVDYYEPAELLELAGLCGLPVDELQRREINEAELSLILADLSTFARQWDPRLFASTARRVKELKPNTDMYELLHEQDPETYLWLLERLEERPDAVEQ